MARVHRPKSFLPETEWWVTKGRPGTKPNDIAAFGIPGFVQATAECIHEVDPVVSQMATLKADDWKCWLLRASRDRLRRHRGAKQRDELAALPARCFGSFVKPTADWF